jgi:hypothetical protein
MQSLQGPSLSLGEDTHESLRASKQPNLSLPLDTTGQSGHHVPTFTTTKRFPCAASATSTLVKVPCRSYRIPDTSIAWTAMDQPISQPIYQLELASTPLAQQCRAMEEELQHLNNL